MASPEETAQAFVDGLEGKTKKLKKLTKKCSKVEQDECAINDLPACLEFEYNFEEYHTISACEYLKKDPGLIKTIGESLSLYVDIGMDIDGTSKYFFPKIIFCYSLIGIYPCRWDNTPNQSEACRILQDLRQVDKDMKAYLKNFPKQAIELNDRYRETILSFDNKVNEVLGRILEAGLIMATKLKLDEIEFDRDKELSAEFLEACRSTGIKPPANPPKRLTEAYDRSRRKLNQANNNDNGNRQKKSPKEKIYGNEQEQDPDEQ